MPFDKRLVLFRLHGRKVSPRLVLVLFASPLTKRVLIGEDLHPLNPLVELKSYPRELQGAFQQSFVITVVPVALRS